MTTVYTRASKGSALTWAEGDANINNLNNDKIEAVVEDLTPQLGGDLDVQTNKITTSTVDGDILIEANGTGIIQLKNDTVIGDGVNTAYLTSFGARDLALVTNGGTNSGTITITQGANGDITLTPNGTGAVIIDGNEHPQTQGAVGEVLTADGSGLVEWKLPGGIVTQVYNADSVQINKGEPVYVFGSSGTNISVKRALNTGDATSAQTLGLAAENIAVAATGNVVCQGVLRGVDTSAYTAGDALYLGATAGSKTTTKPYAPNHLVYLGFVETVNAVSGRIYVRVQNGYELEEIHNVQITTTPTDGDVLTYDSVSGLWKALAPSGGITDLISDLSPQLGGDLDVNDFEIVNNITNGDIVFRTNGLGLAQFITDGISIGTGTSRSGISSNGNYALDLVTNDGTNSGYISILPGANSNIEVIPNGTGRVNLDNLLWPTADGTNGQLLTTNGSGSLSFTSTAPQVTVTQTATNAVHYPIMSTSSGTGSKAPALGVNFTMNPSTGEFVATRVTAAINGTVGATTPSTGAFTTLSASSTVSGTGFSTYLASPPAIGGTAAAAGTFTTLTANTSATLKAISEGALFDLGTTGGTIAPNVANGNVQKITLNSALTINAFTSPVAGQSLTLIIYGGSAYTSITSTMKFAGGNKTLTGTTGCIDILSVYYDGTNYFASIAKGFA